MTNQAGHQDTDVLGHGDGERQTPELRRRLSTSILSASVVEGEVVAKPNGDENTTQRREP